MNINYRDMAIRFSGALWQQGICPECGCEKERHFSTCAKHFEKLDNPREVEKVFVAAFEKNKGN